MRNDGHLAASRFGFGPGPDDRPPVDARDWLRAQLGGPDQAEFPQGLPAVSDGLLMLREQRRLKPPPGQSLIAPLYRADSEAQLAELLGTRAPFRERLVWFWANHFTVSVRRNEIRPIAGCFVREAIRPHVTGRFGAMLLAVMRHPAMLLYLDNAGSVGPDSDAGRNGRRGLNENLARECLELHTVSPASGYTQADVTSFASILTGWSVDMKAAEPGYRFRPHAHQPGDKSLLGQVIPDGETGGMAALALLSTHPATYRHLAWKLATHFVADAPPASVVSRLAGVLARTGGDLLAVSLALVDLPEAWTPLAKFRTPLDLVIAAARALDLRVGPQQGGSVQVGPEQDRPEQDGHARLTGMMAALGQPVWGAPLPNGWPDRAADWAGPEAMLARIDWAYRVAGHAGPGEPYDIARAALGATMRPDTVEQIARAGDRRDALTLLLTSPEFQRR